MRWLRYVRGVWRIIRANRLYGGTLEPTTDFVTLTIRMEDGRLRRIHRVPSRHVRSFVDSCARRGEVVVIAEEAI